MNPGYLLAQSQQTSSSACRSTSESASLPPSPAAAAFFLAAFSSSCRTKSPPFPYSPHPQLICHFSETLWSATQSQPPSHTVPIHSWSVMFQLNTVVCNAKFPPPHPTFPYSPHPQLICHFSETLWSATQSQPPSHTVPIHSWSVMFQLNTVVCNAKFPPPHPTFPYSPHPQLICHFSETLWSATQSQPPSHTVPIHSWSVMFQLNTVVCNAKFPPPHPTFPYSPHPQLICHFSETLWSATQSHPPSPTVPIHSWSVMFQLNIVVCHAKSPQPHLSLQSPSTADLSLLWNIVVRHTVTPIPSPPPPPLPLQSTAGHHILFKHNRLPHKAIPPPPPYPPPRHPFILLQGVFNKILYWDKETHKILCTDTNLNWDLRATQDSQHMLGAASLSSLETMDHHRQRKNNKNTPKNAIII